MTQLRRQIGLRDLILFNIAAVTSMRWLAAAAHAGPISLVLWVIAGTLFFFPSAIAVSTLARRFPAEGGLYVWTKESFGEWHGFLCGYSYVLANLLYFGSLSLAIASAVAVVAGLSPGPGMLLVAALGVLWIATGLNVVGGRLNQWIGNAAGGATCAVCAALVVIALVALLGRGTGGLLAAPDFRIETLNLWSQMAFAYVGLELSAILCGEIRNPERAVPVAAAASGAAVVVFYILGTLAILTLLAPADVNPVTGLVDAFRIAGTRFAVPSLGVVFGTLVILAMAGQLGAWIGGSARLPFVIGMDRYLPPFLASIHPRWRTPWLSLLSQSGAASVLAVALVAGETARAGYQLLVDITVLLTFLPFVYIFLAAWKVGSRASAVAGLSVTIVAMLLSLVPPAEVSSMLVFEVKVIGGCLFLIGLGWLNFRYARLKTRRT